MVVSWTLSMHEGSTRVIFEGGGFQARANLNGGELGEKKQSQGQPQWW